MAETSSSEDTSGNFGIPRVVLRGAKRVEPPIHEYGSVRINLHDLKGKLSKILGPNREREYLAVFSGFLSQRLSKVELDKRLLQTLGRDNIYLHNQFVKAIFRNASCGEAPPNKRKHVDTQSPTSPLQVAKRARTVQDAEEEEEAEEQHESDHGQAAIMAPLGVTRAAAARRRVKLVFDDGDQLLETQLPDGVTLHRRLERIAVDKSGLQGVCLEHCADIVNYGVDIYLRRIIGACIQMMQARRSSQAEALDPISILDFQVAVESNPQQLGANWPTHLERLSLRAFERHRQPG